MRGRAAALGGLALLGLGSVVALAACGAATASVYGESRSDAAAEDRAALADAHDKCSI